mgnify:CR=1 FL=1
MNKNLHRGKSKATGKWVKGYLIGDDVLAKQGTTYDLDEGYINGLDADEVDPYTVGMSTGIIDENDVEIFEGDIVEVTVNQVEDVDVYGRGAKKIGYIVYDDNYGLYTCKNNFMNFITWSFNDYKVIGNVFDNVKLLEKNHE